MKRGQSLEEAAHGWRVAMEQIEALTADLPADRVHASPTNRCARIRGRNSAALCRFLDLEFSEAMLQRPDGKVHHIGGSPSKFDAARTAISLDRSHEGAFSTAELETHPPAGGRRGGEVVLLVHAQEWRCIDADSPV